MVDVQAVADGKLFEPLLFGAVLQVLGGDEDPVADVLVVLGAFEGMPNLAGPVALVDVVEEPLVLEGHRPVEPRDATRADASVDAAVAAGAVGGLVDVTVLVGVVQEELVEEAFEFVSAGGAASDLLGEGRQVGRHVGDIVPGQAELEAVKLEAAVSRG